MRLLFLCVIAALLHGCQPATSTWKPLAAPVTAPDFTLPVLTGGTVTLSGLRGQVVVMEFWATWCGPCRFSTPSLDAVYRKFRDRRVSVLLINEGEDADRVRAWVQGRFQAPILLDADTRVGWQYGVQGIPRLFVVDQAGQIVYVRSGYSGGLERNLEAAITQLLTAHGATAHGG